MNLIIFAAIAIALLVWNIVTLTLYGLDKSKAKKGKWRISESTLIACAFMMGAIGALAGMSVFRHKTKNIKFKVLVPMALIVNIGIAALVLRLYQF